MSVLNFFGVATMLLIYSLFFLNKPIAAQNKSQVSDQDWEKIISYLASENHDKAKKFSEKLLKKFDEDDTTYDASNLRYMYLYSISGLVSYKKITQEEGLKLITPLSGKTFVTPFNTFSNCMFNCLFWHKYVAEETTETQEESIELKNKHKIYLDYLHAFDIIDDSNEIQVVSGKLVVSAHESYEQFKVAGSYKFTQNENSFGVLKLEGSADSVYILEVDEQKAVEKVFHKKDKELANNYDLVEVNGIYYRNKHLPDSLAPRFYQPNEFKQEFNDFVRNAEDSADEAGFKIVYKNKLILLEINKNLYEGFFFKVNSNSKATHIYSFDTYLFAEELDENTLRYFQNVLPENPVRLKVILHDIQIGGITMPHFKFTWGIMDIF